MANEAEIPRTDTLGEVLRRYRQAAGLSQEALAERAQLSWRAISDLERGMTRAPRRETLRLLADALALPTTVRAELETVARPLSLMQPGDAPAGAARPGQLAAEPPLVGRGGEVALLERHLAGDGPPVLLLAGEPGIGKSRLLRESSRLAEGTGWRVLSGGCQRQGSHAPYAPVLGALTTHIQDQTVPRQRMSLQGCAWLVRLLPELAGSPLAPLPIGSESPDQERRLMYAAVARYLRNVAGPSGTVLILDDLQWAGADALDLLTSVLHAVTDVPLRVIGAYRDTEVQLEDGLFVVLADLASAGLVQQHTLRPLDHGAAGQLLDVHLNSMQGDADVRAQLVARAGGVPFFLVSCAQGLRADGPSESAHDVPWTVTQSVRQRVAALTAGARDLLGIAAVAGRQVPYALLLAVAQGPEREVLAVLQGACRARLMDDVAGGGVRFAHDVIREVVEADLGAGQRMLLHRDIAQALEHLPGEPPVEDLAYHYARSGDHASAALWLERAGDKAAVGFAHASTLAQYMEARARLVLCAVAPADFARVDEKVGDLHTQVGDFAQACAAYALARTETTVPAQRVDLTRKEGECWAMRGDLARGRELFAAAATLAAESPDGAISGLMRARLEVSQSGVFYLQGDYQAAETAVERAQTLLHAEEPSAAVDACFILVHCQSDFLAATRGDLAQAHLWEQRADVRRAHDIDPKGLAHASTRRGLLAYRLGEMSEADDCLRHSLALWESIGDLQEITTCWHLLGNLALCRGDLDEAEARFEQSLLLSERTGSQVGSAALTHLLGIVFRERGDLARAEANFQGSIAHYARLGMPQAVAWVGNELGATLCRRGDLVVAEACHQRSRIAQEHLGDQRGLLHSWIDLAEVACARGDVQGVSSYCRRARRLARRRGLPFMETMALLLQVQAWLQGSHARSRLRASTLVLAWAGALVATHTFTAEDLPFSTIHMPAMCLTLLTAQLRLQQGEVAKAQTAASEVEHWARDEGRQFEQALALRVLGQCALARRDPASAESLLRAALERQMAIGAALEAARTCLALAQALMAQAEPTAIPVEAQTLLGVARAQFATSGVIQDLAQTEHLTTA